MFDWKRQEGETDFAYKWRVFLARRAGELDDLSWQEISNRIDAVLRPGVPPHAETVYRKEYGTLMRWYDMGAITVVDTPPPTQELENKLEELRRERVRLRDERTEENKQIRAIARVEQQLDHLEELVDKRERKQMLTPTFELVDPKKGRDMIVMLSDLHIGAAFDSAFGKYDPDTACSLLGLYLAQVLELGMKANVENVWLVLLGDLISGNIHKSIAVSNRESVMEQVVDAADAVTEFAGYLASDFPHVHVINVSGNHSRIEPKDVALKDERLDDLIGFIAKRALRDTENVSFCQRQDTTLDWAWIRGKLYAFVHGDFDDMSEKAVAKLSSMIGAAPYCICCGHCHSPLYKEPLGVRVIQGGCLPGSGDDYTVEKRLMGEPSQTALIVDETGIIGHFPMALKINH